MVKAYKDPKEFLNNKNKMNTNKLKLRKIKYFLSIFVFKYSYGKSI